MTQYWCVNCDSSECLEHGIKNDFWMMQYQYEDERGNAYQGGKQASATTNNWRRLKNIQLGDWFVAYLSQDTSPTGNSFFAAGCVRKPRKPASLRASTVEDYVSPNGRSKRSHQHKSGVIYYADASALYEDFDDDWWRTRFENLNERKIDSKRLQRLIKNAKRPSNGGELWRYAQRIDVEEWRHFVRSGVLRLPSIKKPDHRVLEHPSGKAFFRIGEEYFDEIRSHLAKSSDVIQRPPGTQAEDARFQGVVNDVENIACSAAEDCHARGQGFLQDSKQRAELEQYSMGRATRHYEKMGYLVEDHSKGHPYDLKCSRGSETLYVEVKSTLTQGNEIFLTNGEVAFARQNSERMALFVLHSIDVSGGSKKTLSNGVEHVKCPWIVDPEALSPLSYKYDLSGASTKRPKQ